MSQSNLTPLPAGARERIDAAVDAAFEKQIATTVAFAAIPSGSRPQLRFAGIIPIEPSP